MTAPDEKTEPAGGAADLEPAAAPVEDRLAGKVEVLATEGVETTGEAVREQVERVRTLFSARRQPVLRVTALVYASTAIAGTLVALTGGLADWYMHATMYLVVLAYFGIYAQSHRKGRRLPRAAAAVVTVALLVFFAWVLDDLVPARQVVDDGEVSLRPELPLLRLPAALLLLTAALLLVHWLFFARLRDRARA